MRDFESEPSLQSSEAGKVVQSVKETAQQAFARQPITPGSIVASSFFLNRASEVKDVVSFSIFNEEGPFQIFVEASSNGAGALSILPEEVLTTVVIPSMLIISSSKFAQVSRGNRILVASALLSVAKEIKEALDEAKSLAGKPQSAGFYLRPICLLIDFNDRSFQDAQVEAIFKAFATLFQYMGKPQTMCISQITPFVLRALRKAADLGWGFSDYCTQWRAAQRAHLSLKTYLKLIGELQTGKLSFKDVRFDFYDHEECCLTAIAYAPENVKLVSSRLMGNSNFRQCLLNALVDLEKRIIRAKCTAKSSSQPSSSRAQTIKSLDQLQEACLEGIAMICSRQKDRAFVLQAVEVTFYRVFEYLSKDWIGDIEDEVLKGFRARLLTSRELEMRCNAHFEWMPNFQAKQRMFSRFFSLFRPWNL